MPCDTKKAKNTKLTLARHYKAITAKHTGLAQVPDSAKRSLDEKVKKMPTKTMFAKHWKGITAKHACQDKDCISHGPEIPVTKNARHSGIGMDEYALLDIPFLKPGEWNTNGKDYDYSWDIISKHGKSFKDQEFFINHADTNGAEMGLIDDTYEEEIDGENWLVATVKVPETSFTKSFLDRVENGLIKAASSTHQFKVDKDNPGNNEVIWMKGSALSTVRKGEVDGAGIRSVKRHIRSPERKAEMRKMLAKHYKKLGG